MKPSRFKESTIIVFTFILVIGLGLMTFSSITNFPEQTGTKLFTNINSSTNSKRSPAFAQEPKSLNYVQDSYSLNSQPQQTASSESVNWDCSQQLFILSQTTNRLRLTAKNCSKGNLEKIQNLTNGYQANTFNLGSTRFTTDYIDLQPGKNELQITFQQKNGQIKTLALRIDRQ